MGGAEEEFKEGDEEETRAESRAEAGAEEEAEAEAAWEGAHSTKVKAAPIPMAVKVALTNGAMETGDDLVWGVEKEPVLRKLCLMWERRLALNGNTVEQRSILYYNAPQLETRL